MDVLSALRSKITFETVLECRNDQAGRDVVDPLLMHLSRQTSSMPRDLSPPTARSAFGWIPTGSSSQPLRKMEGRHMAELWHLLRYGGSHLPNKPDPAQGMFSYPCVS